MGEVRDTNQKGYVGELAVLKDLVSNYPTYSVFQPAIDSGVDFLVERRAKHRRYFYQFMEFPVE